MKDNKEEIITALKALYREHHYGDDCWYTCPAHPEGCCDSTQGKSCNCGAEEHNRKLDDIILRVKNNYL